MRKVGIVVLGLALGGVLACGGVALASSAEPHITTAETIHSLEHDTHTMFVDVDNNHKPSVGDMYMFAGTLTDLSTHKQIGTVDGHCVLSWGTHATCEATASLARGIVEVAGTTANQSDFDLAVTGGTGTYQNARGEIHIHDTKNGDSIDTVHLIP